MIGSILAAFLSLAGAAFLLVAAVGLIRMEDVYTRLHGASKAAPFGATLLLIGVAVASGAIDAVVRVVVICVFLLATAPIAAHVIGRAAYLRDAQADPSAPDDLEGKYDRSERTLASTPEAEQFGGPDDASTPSE